MSDEEKTKAEELNDQYDHTEKKLNEKAKDETYDIAGFLAYDITFLDADGNKMEPNGNVKISMDYKKAEIPEEAKKALDAKQDEQKLDVTVMHLEEDEQGEVKEVVDMVADETKEATVETTETKKVKKAEFVTNNFSVFALTWQNSLSSLETRGTTETVKITDDIINSGALKATSTSGSVKTYTWYRSSEKTGTYTKVDAVNYNTGSEIKTNISQDQTQLFPAYDNGDATGARQWYKVEVELTNGEKITSEPIQVTYFKELQNGGFETPTATNFSTQYSNAYYKEKEGVWQTTGTGTGDKKDCDIEIVKKDIGNGSSYAWNKVAGKLFSSDGTYTNTDGTYEDGHDWKNAAYEGKQFAELNCEASGALYQDVLTKDGTALNYWLSHRARGNGISKYVLHEKDWYNPWDQTTYYPGANVKQYDTMFLVMMPTKTAIEQKLTTQDSLKNYLQKLNVNYSQTATEEENEVVYNNDGIKILRITSSNQKWHSILATNDYIPTSSLTRFFFMAGETASGDPTVGNFLDNVGFSQELPPVADDEYSIEINKNFSGLSSTQINNIKNNLKFEISVTDNETNQTVDDATVRNLFGLTENAPLEISGSNMTSQPNGNLKYTLANKKITYGKSYTVTLTEKNADLSGYQLTTTTETKVKVGDAAEQTTPNTTSFTLTGKTIATVSFTNAYEAANKKKVNFTKVWDDNNNFWNTRPESLTVTLKATYDVEENGQYVTKELTATDLGLASLDQTLTADNKWTCNWNVPVYKILNQETGLKVKIDYTVEEGNVDSDYVYTSPSNGKAVSGDGNDYKKQTWNANTITTPDSKASADSTGSNSKKSTLSKVKAKVVSLFDDETTTVISDSTNTTSKLGEPVHRKYITYNKNTNDYTLNLDVTGAEGVADGVDVLFVIDTSGSMGSGRGSTYTNLLPEVKKLLNGTTGTTGIVDQILNANAKNAVAYVSFAGVDETKTTDWYTAKNSTTFKNKVNNLKAEGGTNWTYAMQKADSVLKKRTNNNKKVVIFLSDGKPTYSIDNDGDEYGHGNETSASYYTEAINAVKNSSNLKTVDQFYSVYLTTGTKSGMEKFHDGIKQTVKGAAIVDGSGDKLGNALSSIINQVIPTYKDVEITDTLSDYVEFTGANPEITVKMVDANGNETSLSPSDYTVTNTNNSVKVTFNNPLVKGATYTVSFHVKPTQKANDEFSSTGYPNIGESGTGSSSAGKKGFFSNKTATLSYKVDGTNDPKKTVNYQKPVIQVLQHTLTYKKVWKQPSNVNLSVDSIDLNVNYSDGTSGTVTLNKTTDWTTTEDVPITKTIESVTEKTPVADYTASYSYPSSTEAVVTNNYSKVTTNTVKVNKIWKNDGPKETVTVALMQSELTSNGIIGEAKELYTADLTETNNWSCEWTNLVTESSDATSTKNYVYGVVEKNIPAGYQSNIEYNFTDNATNVTITNTYDKNCADENYYIANVLQTEQLNIRKEWDDNNNVADLRPDSLEVTVDGMHFTLNANQKWETSATVLKKKAIADKQVMEDSIANYTNTGKEITREDSATQVVFHNQLISKNITVQKVWHDNITDHSNDYVAFKLEGTKDNGTTWKEFGNYNINADTTDSAEWTCVIENLPIGYEYKVTETDCSNKKNYVSAVTNTGDIFTITNTLKWSAKKVSEKWGEDDTTTVGVGLSGAEFELKSGNTVIATGVSETDGNITWTPKDHNELFTLHGSYTIHETKAPAGYVLNVEDWNVTFENGLLTKLNNNNVKGTAENGVVIELGNKKLYSLPSTGGTGIYLYMIGGMLLMFAAVWILYKSKCKEVLEK